MWSISLGALGGVSNSLANQTLTVAQAAVDYWSRYIDTSLASLEVEISFINFNDGTLAQGGTDFYFDHSSGGFNYLAPSTVIELLTGVDSNGSVADVQIEIDAATLIAGEFSFGPIVDGVSVGGSGYDLWTVIVHEIGHALGFLSFIGDQGADRSTFDEFVQVGSGGSFFFDGPGVVFGPQWLADDPSHLGFSSLMYPTLLPGRSWLLSIAELSIFHDIGVPLKQPTSGDDDLWAGLYIPGAYPPEQLTGLDGNDTLHGLPTDGWLDGGAGDDSLVSGAGGDLMYGGDGDDILIGGGGLDTGYGAAGADTLHGGEDYDFFDGGDGSDLIYGDGDRDALSGGSGDDTVNGGDGADGLSGGPGTDLLDGGNGIDTAHYSTAHSPVAVSLATFTGTLGDALGDVLVSIEKLIGSNFADLLSGGAGDDNISGSDGHDTLIGDSGDDTLRGDYGNDRIFAGLGHDRADGGFGDDFARTSNGSDTLLGGYGNDTLGAGSGNDILDGEIGADLLLASNGDDRLVGGDGDDTLLGGGGRDALTGGAGNDRLVGGSENDRFNFNPGSGADLIVDFEEGAGGGDVIRLIGFGAAFDDFADVLAAATQAGANVVIDLGGGDTITLQGVTLASLDAGDFAFG